MNGPRLRDGIPAAMIAVFVTSAALAAHLLPYGRQAVLVRVVPADATTAVREAARARAVFVSMPLPGFAVLYGDATLIRAALGLAPLWTGNAPCTPRP